MSGSSFFELYDALLEGVGPSAPLLAAPSGKYWAMAETGDSAGLAMATAGDSRPPLFPEGLAGLSLREVAGAARSWNFAEAGFGLAAANAWYNRPARLEALGCREPEGGFYTDGLEFKDKTVAFIGHMHGPRGLREQARAVYILEKEPQPGDYPDSACDYLLPQCDIVIITGSSLVNKTLPHLLELCRDAYTILTGPSVPMCPALLDFGIDRLAGLVLTDLPGIRAHVTGSVPGSPYRFGLPFRLDRAGGKQSVYC